MRENKPKNIKNTKKADKAPKKVTKNKPAENAPKKAQNNGNQNKHKQQVLNVFTANANGLKNKVVSLKSNITSLAAGIFTIQESNYNKRGCLNIENFEIFEAIRKKKGGGTILGAHKALEPILIQEYSDEYELIVIEVSVGGKVIRVMKGYGPQETWTPDQRMPFLCL